MSRNAGFFPVCIGCPLAFLCLMESPPVIYQCQECREIVFFLIPSVGVRAREDIFYGVKLGALTHCCPYARVAAWERCIQHRMHDYNEIKQRELRGWRPK